MVAEIAPIGSKIETRVERSVTYHILGWHGEISVNVFILLAQEVVREIDAQSIGLTCPLAIADQHLDERV